LNLWIDDHSGWVILKSAQMIWEKMRINIRFPEGGHMKKYITFITILFVIISISACAPKTVKDRYQVEEEVEADGLVVKVLNAYSTNILENKELGSDTQLYDNVVTDCCFFIRFIATNKGKVLINLKDRMGLYHAFEDGSEMVIGGAYADVTNIVGKDALDFYLDMEDYNYSFDLNPGEQKEIQMIIWTMEKSSKIDFSVHLPDWKFPPEAIIEVSPMQRFVCTYEEARQKVVDKYGSNLTDYTGVLYKLPDDNKEMFYYAFATGTAGSADEKFYLVKMETGVIYIGEYSDEYPVFPAIPIEPVE
jgi:hypothetical protein